ncbi:MAG: hypothetical protein MJ211_14565 [Bacteroidales bacterium]|nr:hypothetical protein [Bacteroidales bacterium]
MRRFAFLATLLVASFLYIPLQSSAQCKEFTEEKVLPLLEDYVISGRYNSIKLYEGEEILIFKTLSKGINYRFVVKGDDEIPKDIEFNVESWEGDKIYSNKSNNFNSIWDFQCNKTQRIKIFVKVPLVSKANTEPKRGCVTLLCGIKSNE